MPSKMQITYVLATHLRSGLQDVGLELQHDKTRVRQQPAPVAPVVRVPRRRKRRTVGWGWGDNII